MSRRIHVRVSPIGEITVEADGFQGKGCEAATKAIEEALARMGQALDSFVLEGVTTTIPFLGRVIRHPDFVAGRVDTKFLERQPQLFDPEA